MRAEAADEEPVRVVGVYYNVLSVFFGWLPISSAICKCLLLLSVASRVCCCSCVCVAQQTHTHTHLTHFHHSNHSRILRAPPPLQIRLCNFLLLKRSPLILYIHSALIMPAFYPGCILCLQQMEHPSLSPSTKQRLPSRNHHQQQQLPPLYSPSHSHFLPSHTTTITQFPFPSFLIVTLIHGATRTLGSYGFDTHVAIHLGLPSSFYCLARCHPCCECACELHAPFLGHDQHRDQGRHRDGGVPYLFQCTCVNICA